MTTFLKFNYMYVKILHLSRNVIVSKIFYEEHFLFHGFVKKPVFMQLRIFNYFL